MCGAARFLPASLKAVEDASMSLLVEQTSSWRSISHLKHVATHPLPSDIELALDIAAA